MKKRGAFESLSVFAVLAFSLAGMRCAAPPAAKQEPLAPKLVMETPDTAIRDIAVAEDGSIFTFDYRDYKIRKYEPDGRFLLEFGGAGTGDGRFSHLTGLRVSADRLLAVDSVGLLTFDLDGRFLGKQAFVEDITPDFSVAFGDGRYIGYQINAAELKAVLTYRSPQGKELDRLASHDLREFFPDLKAGEDFFLSDQYARNYLYDIGPDESVCWAASDALRIFRYRGGKSEVVYSEPAEAVPFPQAEKAALLKKKAGAKPPFHAYVPDVLPVLQHLAVEPGGDLWIYVQSRRRTGFLRLSTDGKVKGLVSLAADFNVRSVRVRVFGRRMYFISGRSLYAADLPGS